MNNSAAKREYDDIRAILKEVAEMHRQSEAERKADAAKLRREMAEKEAERKADAAKFRREMDERRRQFEAERKEDARRLKRWEKQFGGYTETESMCLEDEFRDALAAAGEIGGVKIESVHCRALAVTRGGKTLGEYDVVAGNCEKIFVGEIKHKLTAEDVREFYQKLLRYPKHFPSSSRGKEICGMVGGAQIDKNAAAAADELCMYVLRLKNNRKLAVTAPKQNGRSRT